MKSRAIIACTGFEYLSVYADYKYHFLTRFLVF